MPHQRFGRMRSLLEKESSTSPRLATASTAVLTMPALPTALRLDAPEALWKHSPIPLSRAGRDLFRVPRHDGIPPGEVRPRGRFQSE